MGRRCVGFVIEEKIVSCVICKLFYNIIVMRMEGVKFKIIVKSVNGSSVGFYFI